MATQCVLGPPGCRSVLAMRLLLLPVFLGCCITFVRGTIEEMMIAPIEVIEEWGCYDTEIRLTCGNLESKIAILEARFTPHCQDQRNCVYMDENSIAHPFASQQVDKLILEETEAGRRFLATLRRNHEKELVASGRPGGDVSELSAAPRSDGSSSSAGGSIVAARSLAKDKRSSLRATLEDLIVRYLRRLTSRSDDDADDGEDQDEAARYRRQLSPVTSLDGTADSLAVVGLPTSEEPSGMISNSMEITLLTNDTDTNLTESWDGPAKEPAAEWHREEPAGNGYGFSGLSVSAREWDKSAQLADEGGARRDPGWGRAGGGGEDAGEPARSTGDGRQGDASVDVSASRDKLRDGGTGSDGSDGSVASESGSAAGMPVRGPGSGGGLRRQKQKGGVSECGSVRKRVSQLDRFELERSMRNGSFREYNIRNALNYRCSGKNHCSFVFSQDHPFAVVWKEGTVRIKYICMEEFRISKYCGGHLIVGNEVHWEPLDGDDDEDDGEQEQEEGEENVDNQREQDQHYSGDRTGSPSSSSWQQRPKHPTLDEESANGFANDAGWAGGAPGGADLRDALALEAGFGGGQYRRMVRAGEPRAEALQAATVHSFHNLKILKPIDEPELEQNNHHQQQQQQQHHPTLHLNQQQKQQRPNDTDERFPETEAARNRNRQRQKVFSQDFRVLKILPSNLDIVEDIKQIGNEYYFKKDVEIVVDDRENEIVDDRRDQQQVSQQTYSSSTGTTSDDSEMTETLDIVVLPATPTKDVEIYDTELAPTEAITPGPDGDVSVIGLITSSRPMTTERPTTVSSSGAVAGVETTLGHWDEASLDLPEQEELAENRSGLSVGVDPEADGGGAPFSFNNRTFQNIQETVRRHEFDESQGPYPPLDNYDDDDDEDEDENNEEGGDAEKEDDTPDPGTFDGREAAEAGRTKGMDFAPTSHEADGSLHKAHKQYISVQRTQLRHPLRQGFLMTPSYPKYYIGDSVCQWTLYAGMHQRIKLTVLDLALRSDDECRDYLQVVDLNTNRTLFHSCSESSRLIEIISVQERLEVSVRTTTKVMYPKRGVLIHYTALGCEVPSPTPAHMQLVHRTEHRARYLCDPLYVFPDTGESSRELICTAKHTWNRPLPACIEKRSTEGSGLVSNYEQTRRFGDIDSMSDKQADTVYDILIPSFIIAGLFIVNGLVFAVIMRYRNKRKQRLDLENHE